MSRAWWITAVVALAVASAGPVQGQRLPPEGVGATPPEALETAIGAMASAVASVIALPPMPPTVTAAASVLAAAQAELPAVQPALAAAQGAFAASPLARVPAATRPTYRAQAPEPWLQVDPADSLYRAARDALNRREFDRASDLFASIRTRHPRSGYVPDSYYFQAFALQRVG